MSTYPIYRTPEEGHTRQCQAKALIAAIENLRDGVDSDFDFRTAVQRNEMLSEADTYLTEGLTECICPRDKSAVPMERDWAGDWVPAWGTEESPAFTQAEIDQFN